MDKKDRRWLNPEEELYDLSALGSVEELKQELLHRLMLEEIIHRFAIGLIHPAAKNLSAILDDFVEVLGQFSGTDRCYIFLFGADGKSMDNTQEWAAPGISPEKQNLQGLPLDVFPWWVQRVQSGKVINILDVSKMPPEASAEQQILQMQDIQSLLVVPLAVEHRSIGFLGFDSVRGQKRWTRQDINLLQTVSGIIASSIEREKSLERVLQNEQRYRNLFEHSNDAIFLLDREGKHIKVNLKAGEMLGYDPEEIVSLSYRDLVAPEEIDDSDSTLSRVLRGELPPLYEKTMVRKDGSRVPVEINLSILRGPTGEPEILQSVVRDITFRKKAAQELFRMANEDALTGLFNRRKFSELVSRRLGQQTPFSLLFMDLDGFKEINDTSGHSAGDLVLKKLSERMEKLCAEIAEVARFGGDEFAFLFPSVEEEKVKAFSYLLLDQVEKEIVVEGWKGHLGASIGVSRFPVDGNDLEHLFKSADIAMYESKNGREPITFFQKAFSEALHHQMELKREIHQGLQKDSFVLYYQPILKVKTGRIHGYECLVRWNHPQKGILPPISFVPFAEKVGLLQKIDRKVRSMAFQKLKDFAGAGQSVSLSMNITAPEFLEKKFVREIESLISRNNIDPTRVVFEITEGTFLEQPEQSIEKIKLLKGLGIRFSIDDFGTGYSSLSYLTRIPVDYVKIDREFIRVLDVDHKSRAIVESTFSMARSLGFGTVCEGVETHSQMKVIEDLGGDMVQGYLFGKPAPL